MKLNNIVLTIVAVISLWFALFLIIQKQINNKNNIKRLILAIIIFIYCLVSAFFIPNQFRFLFFVMILAITISFIYKININESFIYAFNTEIIITCSELFISILMVMFGVSSKDIINNYLLNMIANILIAIFSVLLIMIPLVRKLFNKILNLFKTKKYLNKLLYIFLLVLYLLMARNGLSLVFKSNYYINILFLVLIIIIISLIIKAEARYDKVSSENKQMLNYVTKYEKIITEQGKANHEFKNQLMVIYGYAKMNSPKLIEYIESTIEDARKTQSSYLISQLNKFPDGGIKGLLYYKLSVMNDLKIKYEINVEQGIKSKLKKLSIDMNKDITKILGVLLDNSIESSSKCKDKKIIISVTKEKNAVLFTIQNTYKGEIDIKRIGTGYTTKGKGHGYGLKLINDLVSKNTDFNIKNYIDNNYYTCDFSIAIKIQKKKKK